MKCLKCEDGISLIQVLLLSGALASAGLISVQSLKKQKDVIQATETKTKVEHIHRMIYSILQNRNHCLETIMNSPGGKIVSPGTTRFLETINMLDSTVPAFQSGPDHKYMNEAVSIESMQLRLPANLKDLADLDVLYKRIGNRHSMGSETVKKTIKISLQRLNANELQSCSSVTNDDGSLSIEEGNANLSKEICEDYDMMEWDDDLRTCHLKDNLCPTSKIFAGIDSNGNKICKDLITYLPHLVEPTFIQSCPPDYDQVKINRYFVSPYRISIECNKKDSSCPSMHVKDWQVGPSVCVGYLTRGNDGEIVKAIDDALPSLGEASFLCDKGIWKIQSPNTCSAPCDAGTLNWTVGAGTCSAEVPESNDGASVSLSDTDGTSVGTSDWACTNGSWVAVNETCTSPCVDGIRSWSQDSLECTANVPAMANGGNLSVTDNDPPIIGTASYSCTNGILILNSGSNCKYSDQPGVCKWASEVTWEFPGCVGFQVNETINSSHTQAVNNPQECSDLCNTCMGSSSYSGCTFTPN
jgi:hypothetical protein